LGSNTTADSGLRSAAIVGATVLVLAGLVGGECRDDPGGFRAVHYRAGLAAAIRCNAEAIARFLEAAPQASVTARAR
jgi:hypothetical protein